MSIDIDPASREPPIPSTMSACPVCGAPPVCSDSERADIVKLPRLPVHVGVVYPDAASSQTAPHGRMTLARCTTCGLLYNRTFEPELLVFETGYEVQLIHSPKFKAFMQATAERLIDRYDVRDRRVLDVGCGAGHFLRMLCHIGNNDGVGVDPTLPSDQLEQFGGRTIRLESKRFDPAGESGEFDLVVCQSMLEAIANPVAMLAGIGRVVEPNQGHLYLEVFNAVRSLESGEMWSFCYEQCNYFGLDSFTCAARQAGLEILERGGCFGDEQYVYLECRPGSRKQLRSQRSRSNQSELEVPSYLSNFGQRFESNLKRWSDRLNRWRQDRRRVVLWGSGGKGICFLSAVDPGPAISAVVDINPARQSKYTPGTGHVIVGPDWLTTHRPDVVLVSNPLYLEEIRQMLSGMGIDCQLETI